MSKCLRCGATAEWIQGRVLPEDPESITALETELTAAMAANQRLEKERDGAVAMQKNTLQNVRFWEESAEKYRTERDHVRVQVASLTAERDALKTAAIAFRIAPQSVSAREAMDRVLA